ncbi:BCCT family transporter [Craterilacuibacter sp. RT1T]|uniref:glycine betaine uptake BCCT transporter n=1 Tax=Craterilacuibacter sp. RT1T TaxID=2942211 RepID=UPI0020BD6C69|nr:BCCT family transporter [Craterilacuibacter sp. RT1T]MCL6264751.1 BCCT family transporter [Craterilacuibacter sp. RT1T]
MVLRISLALTVLFALFGVFFPELMNQVTADLLSLTIARFGWFYLLAVFGFLLFTLYLACSRFAQIRLGGEDAEPEFSRGTWFAMLFSAGMGIGLVFWGTAEPLSHFASPSQGISAQTPEAARMAMHASFFHWGLHPWAIYSVMGLALAYFKFNRGAPGLISAVFRPLLGDRVEGPIGKTIDILAVLATAFGVATSLGFGALQIEAGLKYLFAVPSGTWTTFAVIAIATVLFVLSSMTGLTRGIRILSNLNLWLAVGLLLLVAILGPTAFIFEIFTTTLGDYLDDLIAQSLKLTPYSQNTWVAGWTLFYWAWWITWAPFVGMFIARVSKGRTIREFVVGVLLVPALASFIWFSVFGGTGLWMQLFGHADLVGAVGSDVSTALYHMFAALPGGAVISGLAMLLVLSFFVTSADSATFVLGMLSSGGSLNPGHRVKLVWGVLVSVIALILLSSGGLKGLQSMSIITALPFALIMVGMMVSLYRALSQDERRQRLHELELKHEVERLMAQASR